MFFPYSTDAPIYYWPITTVLLIAVNVLVFCAELAAPEQVSSYILVFGEGLHPLQWVTCNFLHAGIYHLVGNMLFLWSFGLIVEGKLGWYKTLATYLGIGVLHGAIVQVLMLGSHGGALGASAAIFGFMAMSLVWAPENQMQCVLLLVVYPLYFEVKVVTLVGLFLLVQVATAILTNMAMSSEVLHLIGAGVGFPVAILMLKRGLVDCENWDIFSVWAGRHTMTPEEREAADAPRRADRQQDDGGSLPPDALLEQIRQILRGGRPLLALRAHQRLSRELPGWVLPRPDLWNLIQALQAEKLWAESVPPMEEYLAHYAEHAAVVRLRLAQVLLAAQNRPDQALKVLAQIDLSALDGRQRELIRKLRTQAEQLPSAVGIGYNGKKGAAHGPNRSQSRNRQSGPAQTDEIAGTPD